jgi:hypothetical protein
MYEAGFCFRRASKKKMAVTPVEEATAFSVALPPLNLVRLI